MGEKISVVIPVYKVEAYLGECLDSVINQTYRNLEIILVDDASPDGSGEICDRYAAKDARIRSVHLEKNKGQVAARNKGMELATGEYLFFADSDDRLAEYTLEKLYDGLKKYGADCSVGILTVLDKKMGKTAGKSGKSAGKSGKSAGKDGRSGKSAGKSGKSGKAGKTAGDGKQGNGPCGKQWAEHCETAQEAMERVFLTGASACNRLYRREALGDLRFPDGRINEDEFFVLRAYERMGRIAYMDCETYFYIKRENSTTTSAFSLKMLDYVRNGRENVEFAAGKYPGLLAAAEYKYCKSMLWCYVNLRKIKGDAQVKAACRQLRGEIREHKGMALSNPHLGLCLKVLAVAICIL